MVTIRDRIKSIATQMLSSKPTPAALREFEVSLAGLLWSINDEVCAAELEFRKAVLVANSKTAAGKKQIAEAGPEFARLIEARATHESCMEMLRTCRSNVRSVSEEMRLQR
jgi:hypothetical protein